MKISHIITRFIQGGADENTLFSCNIQARQGHQVFLIYGSECDSTILNRLDPKVEVFQLPALVRPISVKQDMKAFWSCLKLLKRLKPDLVHTHTSKAGIIGRWAAYFARVPVIVHGVHILPHLGVSRSSRFFYLFLERITAFTTDAFVSVGEGMRDACISDGIGQAEKHVIIPSGMELERFQQAGQSPKPWHEVLKKYDLTLENPRFIVLVSRLEERKGQALFLPEFARIVEHHPDIVLLLVGDGNHLSTLISLISKLNLEKHVVLTGFREDVEQLMAIASVGLLTSKREGLARVLIQYALVGLPIVATDIPGVREVVQPGKNGILVPSDQPETMAQALSGLLSHSESLSAMREASQAMDFSAWSVDTMAAKLEDLYQRLVTHSFN